MSSAPLEVLPLEAPGQMASGDHADPHRPGVLRQQAAERLAQHRQRRGRRGHASAMLFEDGRPEGRNKIAATVAERYAHSPSYRAFLAEEAQRAIRQAEAAAEIAARSAQAVTCAQQELLAELDLWIAPQEFRGETVLTRGGLSSGGETKSSEDKEAAAVCESEGMPVPPVSLTVKLYEEPGCPPIVAVPVKPAILDRRSAFPEYDEAEYLALDDEIAFRNDPIFDDFRDFSSPVEPIAANLIEFPRQLIATKKVRPRLAEGPLREDPDARSSQLRIFEVEPEQIEGTVPSSDATPEWLSIHLDAHTAVAEARALDGNTVALPAQTALPIASISRRMMAAAVDFTLVSVTFLVFTAIAAYAAGSLSGKISMISAAVILFAVLCVCYQMLFFTFADQTPGMRYAHIGLCTFTDENPSRSAMRKRILAQLVAATPFGIGLLWIWLDDERLGWHDRISHMYQRSY